MRHAQVDDDFVATISDHDDFSAEESDPEPEPQPSRRKRKRDSQVSRNGDPTEAKSRKKAKGSPQGEGKSVNGASKATVKGLKGLSSDEDSGSEGALRSGKVLRTRDDGAMNSDFEFEAGDMEFDLVDELDAWDAAPHPAKKGSANNGDKRRVDIDDLVAARRAAKQPEKSNGTVGSGDDFSDLEKGHDEDDEHSLESDQLKRGMHLDEDDEDEFMSKDGFGMGISLGDDDDDDGEDSEQSEGSDVSSAASPVPHPEDDPSPTTDEDVEDTEELARETAFFAPESAKATSKVETDITTFQSMSLSRPILRGLAALNFSSPTPIQAKTIPVALLGKDVVGGAVTGSGKTAAFMIPILERLLYRPRKVPTTRVVVLMPTRELAVQCYNVARKLAAHTDITFAQIVGGLSLREQENILRKRPDVVIATPGRFIDHMRNSVAFAVDAIEILVLDEADRMLEDGFADELNEILTTIPRSRQTMLFSATMTSRVDQLVRVGLQRPVRLLVDAQRQTVGSLTQEFVRLRPGREDKRLAYLMQLVTTIYDSKCIIFFRQKKMAHRARIVFSLCDIKAAELHGSMSQEQRLAAVENFRAGTVTHLLATDVASRGLDIRGVESVLNYEAPQTHAIYLHRVGRTARMGRTGRACTLAAEEDRKVVRQVVKAAKTQGARVASRLVEAATADAWAVRLEKLEEDVQGVLEDERDARALAQADMQVRKGENLLQHAEEIAARPKRTWFATESQKAAAKRASRAVLNGEEQEKGKMLVAGKKVSNKDRKREEAHRERAEGQTGSFKKRKEDRGVRRLTQGGTVERKKGKPGPGGGRKGARAEEKHRLKTQGGKGKKARG